MNYVAQRRKSLRVCGPGARRAAWLLSWMVLVCGCSRPAGHAGGAGSEGAASTAAPAAVAAAVKQVQPVAAQMRNVMFHFSEAAAAHIETLSGQLVAVGDNSMPDFEDKTSFAVRARSARISVSTAALASIINSYVFAAPDAPLKDLSVYIEGDHLHVKGKLHSKGDVPFETIGLLRTTSDGRIRIQSEKLKAFHVPVKGIMNLFGMDLANVLNTSKIPGIETEKDDLLLDLSELLPPPHIEGAVTAVRIENGEIVTIFGNGEAPAPLEKGNYMAFRGGQLRFGKLTMEDSDVTVVDSSPADPLDWFQDRAKDQMVAGYCKITPSFGLRAYVKDYNKLGKPAKK